jgi:hypothetical protein
MVSQISKAPNQTLDGFAGVEAIEVSGARRVRRMTLSSGCIRLRRTSSSGCAAHEPLHHRPGDPIV